MSSIDGYQVRRLKLSQVEPDQHNVRTNSDRLKIEQLGESLSAALDRGEEYLNPITVYPVGRDRYRIKFGHRRYHAALDLTKRRPLSELYFHVVPKPENESVLLREQLEEALHQEGLGPMDKARAIKRYKELTGKSVRQLAASLAEIGLDRDERGQKRGPWWVNFHLKLTSLQPLVQELVADGTLAASTAYRLHALEPRGQVDLAKRIVDEGLSRRELDRLIGEDTEQTSAMDPTAQVSGTSGQFEPDTITESVLAAGSAAHQSSRGRPGAGGPERRNSAVTTSLMIPLPAEDYARFPKEVRRKIERANGDAWAKTATAEQQALARDVIYWGRRSVDEAESIADAVWRDWPGAAEVLQGTLVYMRRLLLQEFPTAPQSALVDLLHVYADELARRLGSRQQ